LDFPFQVSSLLAVHLAPIELARLASGFFGWLLLLGFHGNLWCSISTWLGPVDETPQSLHRHSPFRDNACHHPHNRHYWSHAIKIGQKRSMEQTALAAEPSRATDAI
jgi:hypothetical protein